MGLITKTVKVKWSKRTKTHYVKLGYKFTGFNEEFEVKVEDLTESSHARVYGFCDNCGCDMNWSYNKYNRTKKEEGNIYCFNCAMELYAINNHKKSILNNSISIGKYIIDIYGEEFLWKIWSDKNEKSPFEYCYKTNQKLWWKCLDEKHEDYKRKCEHAVTLEFRCPKCIEEKEQSLLEQETRLYLKELGYEVKTEHNCTIRPINPKTSCPLPFDNEIVLENGKHLIIEVHGEQHYKKPSKSSKYLKKEQTPEEYLHQRKLYDRYKRIKCIQAGYEYLEISYTAFEGKNKELYKQIINNKIKEILNKSSDEIE